ncbi:MAG: SprT family zinc-dependent metalloprotease [Desulfosoma sp.]
MKEKDGPPWPPVYRLRENARAKHVTLRVRPETGLELTVPKGFNPRRLPRILNHHRQWIEEALTKLQAMRQDFQRPDVLPKKIHLAAIDATWTVIYRPRFGNNLELFSIRESEPRLCLQGDFSRVSACCRLLRQWLREEAKRWLPFWVEAAARKTGLSFTKVRITTPKTRWGSYSSRGTVSLNAAVLFLPRELVDMVITHELCHSRSPRHDTAFWSLVARHEPHYQSLEAALRSATGRLPPWYLASFVG